jgi:hypothetical protein
VLAQAEAENHGEGLIPRVEGELTQALPLTRDPASGA